MAAKDAQAREKAQSLEARHAALVTRLGSASAVHVPAATFGGGFSHGGILAAGGASASGYTDLVTNVGSNHHHGVGSISISTQYGSGQANALSDALDEIHTDLVNLTNAVNALAAAIG